MPSLSVSQLNGIVETTLKNNKTGGWTDINPALLQSYIAMSRLLKKNKMMFEGGESLEINLNTGTSGNARHAGLFSQDDVKVKDFPTKGDVPWKHTETSFALDVREKKISRGKTQLVDHILQRRTNSMIDLAVLMEDTFWGKPVDSTDSLTPYGIEYWISKTTGKINADHTQVNGVGFHGGNPTGFASGPGNINCEVHSGWKNFAGNYSAVSKADLIKKMRVMHLMTDFKSPIKHPNYDTSGVSDAYQIYCNWNTYLELEDLLDAQNDNLGTDLSGQGGTMVFKKNQIVEVAKLNEDSSNPLYMMNWNVFDIACLEGEYMRETTGPAPGQHNVSQTHFDLTWNTRVTNRRKLGVLTQA